MIFVIIAIEEILKIYVKIITIKQFLLMSLLMAFQEIFSRKIKKYFPEETKELIELVEERYLKIFHV